MIINEKMLISEILDIDPDIMDVFLAHGLNCVGCPGSYSENLKEAADGHGISLEKLLQDLNQYLGQ